MRSDAHPASDRLRLEVLRRLPAWKRLSIALDLSDFVRQLFAAGLRRRFPDLDEVEFRRLLRERLEKCHNRNY